MRLRTFGGLWIEDSAGGALAGPRPRPLALLAALASAGTKGLSRERVLGVLWPESDPERARHALSQALYSIRRDLGPDVLRATPDQRLILLIPSDVQEFRDAIAARRHDLAATTYVGPFLDGFYLSEAAEFERWAEVERASLAKAGLRAMELAAQSLIENGRNEEASQLWQRLARFDPLSSRYAVRLMESVAASGDRVGALAHGHAHVEAVRRELDAEADDVVYALMTRLREATTTSTPTTPPTGAPNHDRLIGHVAESPVAEHNAELPEVSAPLLPTDPSKHARRRWVQRMSFALVAMIAIALSWRAMNATGTDAANAAREAAHSGDSLVARRQYDEGLRSLYQFDGPAASRRFRAALREDPGSAITAYRAWQAAVVASEADANMLADRALLLTANAPSRDSLLIVTHIGVARNDVAALTAARSLAARFPDDPEALVRAAEAFSTATVDLAKTVILLERAIALDSASGKRESLGPCRACEALSMLVVRYEEADSLDAAERVLRRWSAMRPADPVPWWFLSGVQVTLGDRSAASESRRRYEALGGSLSTPSERLVNSLYSDDLEAANAQCNVGLAAPKAREYTNFRWYCAIALRMEGRFSAAMELVQNGRAPGSTVPGTAPLLDPRLAAILSVETGHALRGAAEFRTLANADNQSAASAGTRAHGVAWHLTLAATALVAGGDTLAAHTLVDSIESVGQRSLAVRGPLLHHFVRGLLHARGGRHEAAARELRAALHAPARGYTRINYELGRSLLALDRAEEAIRVVRAALRGGIEGPELYVTRTELHELLATAFAATGQRDSAAAHYAIVERSWRSADPAYQHRWASAQRWMTTPNAR